MANHPFDIIPEKLLHSFATKVLIIKNNKGRNVKEVRELIRRLEIDEERKILKPIK